MRLKTFHLVPVLAMAMFSPQAFALAHWEGYCQQGGQKVVTSSAQSTTKVQQSYTGATVTVYYSVAGGGANGYATSSGSTITWTSGTQFNANSGWVGLTILYGGNPFVISAVSSVTSLTVTGTPGTNTTPLAFTIPGNAPAAIFSDNNGTVLANPFTCNAMNGYYNFYSANTSLDLVFSGTGISAPYTVGAVQNIDPLATTTGLVTFNASIGTPAQQCTAAFNANQTLIVPQVMAALTTQTMSCQMQFQGGMVQPASGQTVTFTVQSAGLRQICDISLGGHCIINSPNGRVYPQWFGAVADGATDIYPALKEAITGTTSGGDIHFTPGSYKQSGGVVFPQANQTISMETGATLTYSAVPFEVINLNYMFGSPDASPSAPTALTTAVQGASIITMASTTGYTAGRRIIVSSGRPTATTPIEGPMEFNTVASVADGTHLNLVTPLMYSYSTFPALAGATPVVYLMPTNYVHDVKFLCNGGTMRADPAFNSAWMVPAYVENIEIGDCNFNGIGNVVLTGAEVQNLYFHDNYITGATEDPSTAQTINLGAVALSHFSRNTMNLAESGSQSNHFIIDGASHDNVIDSNNFMTISSTSTGAIEIPNAGFNNRIVNNRINGNTSDILAGTVTLGIRNLGQLAGTGNVISGNIISNIMRPVYDFAPLTTATGNTFFNSTLHVNANAFTVVDDASPIIGSTNNITANFTNIFALNAGGPAGLPAVLFCNGSAGGVCGTDNGIGTLGTGSFNGLSTNGHMVLTFTTAAGVTAENKIAVITFGVAGTTANPWYCTADPFSNEAGSYMKFETVQQIPSVTPINTTTVALRSSATALTSGQSFYAAIICGRLY